MSTEGIPYLKRELLQMQDTNELSDTMIKNPELIEENFQKLREKLHWKITLNEQIEFLGQYVLYQLLQSSIHYDLYRAIKLTKRERVIIKIFDKSAIKRGLFDNGTMINSQKQYQEFILKVQIQHQASISLLNNSTQIFMIRPHQLYINSDCIIKVTDDYYGEPLSKILQRRGSLTIEQALAIIKEIIYIVSQLHKQNIIIVELNPELIVYKNGVFKLSDLSSMKKVGQKFTSVLNLGNGYSYQDLIAPQLQVCPEIVDIKSQIWAIGVLFYHMVAHNLQYEKRGLDIVKKARTHNINVETRTGGANQEVLCFLRSVMEINPDERLTWNKLISHPIFEKKQYFNSIKMLPIVDVRPATIKKRQNYVIQQQNFSNGFVDLDINKAKPINSFKEINEKVIFKVVSKDEKVEIKKCLDVESETFYYIEQTNLLALKAVYIYQEILAKINQNKLIDNKRRSHLETVFMIAKRCMQYMKKSKAYESKSSDRRIENYLSQIKEWQQKINDFFLQARLQYESVDKSAYYLSNDIFSFIKSNQQLKEKLKMIKGKQGRDFTLEENIRFTQDKCINKILSQMKESGKKQNALESVKIHMLNYEKICSIKLEDLKSEHSFRDATNKFISYNKISK